MPTLPGRPCSASNCPAQARPGSRFCTEHDRAAERERTNAYRRGYTKQWGKARAAYLSRHPLCVECLSANRVTPATVVDHIKPHRGNQTLFWDSDNWQALCESCHNRKTRLENSYAAA